MKQFDYIIYGATLEGVLVGHYLHQKGFKTLVLESSDKAGGFFSTVENNKAAIHSIFTSPSYDETSVNLAEWIKTNLNLNFEISNKVLPPTTFEKGSFEPFVGFGESAPNESEFLQDFLSAQRLELNPSVNEWIKTILAGGLEIRYSSTLTAINVSDKKITSIVVNDKDTLNTANFIFTENPSDIIEFLATDSASTAVVPQKVLTRLSKGTFWSTLQLSLAHKTPTTDKEEIHVIYGTQKNPVVSIGQFTGKTSQWISFISSDVADINEEGVQILKEMKRQIKRAYPEALENVDFEKIALWPKTHGFIDLKSKAFGQLEGVDNIYLCSNHLVNNSNPFIGALVATQYAIEALNTASPQSFEVEAEKPHSPTNIASHQ
jgi:hypothetical protein